jgi:hypothetical protein
MQVFRPVIPTKRVAGIFTGSLGTQLGGGHTRDEHRHLEASLLEQPFLLEGRYNEIPISPEQTKYPPWDYVMLKHHDV